MSHRTPSGCSYYVLFADPVPTMVSELSVITV